MDRKNKYLNIAKALGIILVVIGHTQSPFNRFIYLFHMPLFFFISGYLYNDKYTDNPFLLFKKRVKSLWLPYVKYQFIFIILHNFFIKIHFYKVGENGIRLYNFRDYYAVLNNILVFRGNELFGSAMWFFPALFICVILFCGINYFVKKLNLREGKRQVLILAITVLMFFSGILRTKMKVTQMCFENTALTAVLIYYLGYLYRRYEDKIKLNLAGGIISFGMLIFIWQKFDILFGMNKNDYPNIFLFVISFVFGIYFIMYVSKVLAKYPCKALNYIGSNTVSIMCLHFIAFKIITYLQIKIYHMPIDNLSAHPVLKTENGWWIVYSITGVVVPIIVSLLTDKIKMIKKCKKDL